jgi:signal transduction histidine kinase
MKQNLFRLFLLLLIVKEAPAQKATDFTVTHYTSENGLPQNSAKGIEMDGSGFLWIATESGLLRFDGQRFRLYDRAHYPILASNRILFLYLSKDGLICFGDEYNHCYTFDKNNKIIPLPGIAYNNFQKTLNSKYRINDGKILSLVSLGIRRWTTPIPDISVSGYTQYAQSPQRFYYFTWYGVLIGIDKQKRRTRMNVTGTLPELNQSITTDNPLGLFNQGGKFYLRQGKGIYELEEKGTDELKATLVLETEEPDICTYLNYPSLNLQVIGSPTHGLYLYRRKQFKVHEHDNGYGNFYAQQPYGDSGVLTNGGPVFPTFSKFNYPFEIPSSLKGIYKDRRGHYWVHKDSVRRIAELDEQLQTVRLVYGGRGVNCFAETPDGRIWLSSFGGDRIGYVEGDTVQWLPHRYPYNSIITFLPLNNEELLLAGNKFLCHLNTRTGKETHYKALEQFTIETLYRDRNQVLWIGTSGNGFFALKQNRHYKLPLDNKGNLGNVHTFMEDKSGFIWMSTNNGLFRTQKAELDDYIAGKADKVYYQYFNKDWGFNINEFNGSCNPSGIVLDNGKFSLPSLDGLVQFYPDSIHTAESGHTLVIDKLSVDDKEMLVTKSVTLAPSFNHLEIEIAAPYFGDPANQLIEYNVQGLDQRWYPVRADNKVTLNRLPYGSYSLQFRAQSGFGKEGNIHITLPFTVTPFYYQTWQFKLALALALCLLIFLLIRMRYAYLSNRNKELEQEVSQRTLHLRNANRLKEKMLMMVGHDLQSPLHFMGLLSQHVQEALDREEIDKVRTGNDEIKMTATKIHAFVEEFSLWSRLQDEHFNISKRKFLLSEVVGELAEFYKEMLLQNRNRLEWKQDQEYELDTNRELLKAMLRNLLDNANKHTRNGIISIRCSNNKDNRLSITVSDTGKGMSEIELNNIQRRIEHKADAFVVSHTSKLGYQLIIDFAASLDAKLAIDSKKGAGTEVIISGFLVQVIKPVSDNLLPGETVSRSEFH